jgi:mono/diheme cytochrome c family protein
LLAAASISCAAGDAGSGDTSQVATSNGDSAPAGAASQGAQLYQRCATCHQPNGQGIVGAFPPLAGSEYANAANPAVPIRVVIHGMQGPVTVHGNTYNGLMPAYGVGIEMSDAEVAAVLTYVRTSWGNSASPITPEQVAEVRAAPRQASGPVTAEELNAMMQ